MKKYSSEHEKLIQEKAEEFQNECHSVVELIKSNTSVDYADATNVWIFRKLAEMQLEIDALKKVQRGKGIRGES
jgi:hypothetical protein